LQKILPNYFGEYNVKDLLREIIHGVAPRKTVGESPEIKGGLILNEIAAIAVKCEEISANYVLDEAKILVGKRGGASILKKL
jgi:hypothetical protein